MYPLWQETISNLIDAAAELLPPSKASTLRTLATAKPDAVVEMIREDVPDYRTLLRRVFRPRKDPGNHRSVTPTHELIVRCSFKGIVTTNYDPGIVTARHPRCLSVRATTRTAPYGSRLGAEH